ncbi:hypothetical protein ALC60_06105 [Trachymyrmex zeteki]|uniref:PDZ domain-containing protein n=1 Tax=Mycetomoellerius zeteki TaxID=64791 RepID=A0A151X3X1_9HYME|nr:hypothetical protein ALC60_06105 [Trachymyrmex zeteki]
MTRGAMRRDATADVTERRAFHQRQQSRINERSSVASLECTSAYLLRAATINCSPPGNCPRTYPASGPDPRRKLFQYSGDDVPSWVSDHNNITDTPRKQPEWQPQEGDSVREDAMPHNYRWERTDRGFLEANREAGQSIGQVTMVDTGIPRLTGENIFKKDATTFDSITPSSCLAAKFRAMQDRYLKSSTNRLIAKIYRKDCKDRERRRLRSFSYGTLPGLEELRTNPLYEEQDQDDNDSGILDNDSATSSLLDDRCSSGASGPLNNSSHNDSCLSPPQLPPRRPFSSATDVDGTARLFASLDVYYDKTKDKDSGMSLLTEEYSSVCQAANSTLIDRQTSRAIVENNTDRERERGIVDEDSRQKQRSSGLQVVRSRAYTTETMVVKLLKETSDQCLGIFIAKTAESSPGYLVAHVVPNGLADKEGTLRIGDEILIVNGKRLRGLSMAEAKKILGNGSGPGDIDIVVSRFSGVDQQAKKLKESSVDYENVSMEDGHGVIVESSPGSHHFRKHQTRCHRDRKDESSRSISSEKFATNMDNGFTQSVSKFCTLPRRPRNTVSTFLTVLFEKGAGKKSLGFTIVGGRDSPKGSIGNISTSPPCFHSHEKQETFDLVEAGTSCFIKMLIIGFTAIFYISGTECPTRTSCPEGPSSAIVSSDSRSPRGRDDVAQSNSDDNDTTSKDISPGGRCLTKDQVYKMSLSASYGRSPRDIFIPSDRENELQLASSRNREIVKSLRSSPKRFLSTQFSFGAHRSGVPLTDGHQRFPQENNVYKNVDERYSVNMALALEAGTAIPRERR